MNWIKTSDRLPEKSQEVIIYYREHGINIMRVATAYYDKTIKNCCFETGGGYGYDIDDVKFWAPLPLGPNEDEPIVIFKIDDYLKKTDASKFLGVTGNTLINWERDGKLKTYRHPLNKYRLYKKEDLAKLLSSICVS